MELAINTVVVLILGTILISMGVIITVRLVDQTNDINDEVDKEYQDELKRLHFADGKRVAVLDPHKTVTPGKSAFFTLGFVNKEDEQKQFLVVTKYVQDSPAESRFSTWRDDKGLELSDNPSLFLFHSYSTGDTKLLASGAYEFIYLLYDTPRDLPAGQYLYDVYICYNDDNDDNNNIDSPEVCKGATPDLYTGTKQRLFITVR